MRQELELEGHAHIVDNSYDDESWMEDRLNEGEAWEIAFEEGERMANDEMIDDWEDEEW